eukprot:4813789-Amphidinium_carterae.2
MDGGHSKPRFLITTCHHYFFHRHYLPSKLVQRLQATSLDAPVMLTTAGLIVQCVQEKQRTGVAIKLKQDVASTSVNSDSQAVSTIMQWVSCSTIAMHKLCKKQVKHAH